MPDSEAETPKSPQVTTVADRKLTKYGGGADVA